ncbi:nicotinate-nucleotide adenylyltransferase [Desulfuromonas sp. TF]|uniref:nicotinate-nucleotide adenylyltransferase n=1 Tax=Desulfuromonas sp. TF TaxID=1232410 RepID=UPI0012DC4A28|nr:nicotinate-nucleotide adenylyltransferase [Desulfuromonas sp. TF]
MMVFDVGVIHGRFQVLHKDHLRYLLAGKALCSHLVVGITNPDPHLTREDPADKNRHARLANPLTYWERYLMVRQALEDTGVASEAFSIVPFPVNLPELYRYYVPLDAVFFLSIYDDWSRKKLSMFRSLALKTHILWEVPPEEKGISGSNVRDLMLHDGPWEGMLPEGVVRLMKKWDIPDRLKKLE